MKSLLHTSEHILGQVLNDLTVGFKTTSLDLREDCVRYDFKAEEMPDEITKEVLEEKVNEIINQNIPVTFQIVSRKEAAEKEIDLSIVPESVDEIRLVNISGINEQACSGDHVKNTKEISDFGRYTIQKFRKTGANAYQIVATITPTGEKQPSTQKDKISKEEENMSTKDKQQKKLGTQPYKGARDFYPEDMQVRNYIFDTWEMVSKRYGFEEYDFPFLEPFEIYAAKTGEEIVNNQLYSFEDRGGRNIAIRPEKTPSLARMVAARIRQLPRPIRWFNIGNCWRFEKPQKGRGREFFQLDCDILGANTVAADAEVFSIPVEIMKALGATDQMFEIRLSNRRLAEYYLTEVVRLNGSISSVGTQMYAVAKIIDSMPKTEESKSIQELQKANLTNKQIDILMEFINADISFVEQFQDQSKGAAEVVEFFEIMEQKGLKKYYKFRPDIMRGFDYYTGNIIEQFDLDPDNNRSMYGGGRYDNLVGLFTNEELSGVGFAMGDMTLIEFLKSWDLLPDFENETKVFVTVFDEETKDASFEVARTLREAGINTMIALTSGKKLDKQLKNADRRGIPFVIIIGPDEVQKGTVILKDMKAKKQEELSVQKVIHRFKE